MARTEPSPIRAYRFRILPHGGEIGHARALPVSSVNFDEPNSLRIGTAFRVAPNARLADVIRERFPDRRFDVVLHDDKGKECARLHVSFAGAQARYGNLRADDPGAWEDVAKLSGVELQPIAWTVPAPEPDAG